MMLVGWVFIFLMVLKILNSSVLLSFFSYGLAVCGLFLGNLGVLNIQKRRRNKQNYQNQNNLKHEKTGQYF